MKVRKGKNCPNRECRSERWGRDGAGVGQGRAEIGHDGAGKRSLLAREGSDSSISHFWQSYRRNSQDSGLPELVEEQVKLDRSGWRSGSCFSSAVEHQTSHIIPEMWCFIYTKGLCYRPLPQGSMGAGEVLATTMTILAG